METEKKKSHFLKEHKMGIFVMISAIIMLIGLSYAWLQITLRGEKELTLTAGSLSLELDDTMAGGIAMESALPVTDEDGLSQEGYTFTLENKGTASSNYTIYLDDLELEADQTRMNDAFIKYHLTRDGEEIGFDLLSTTGEDPNRVLDVGSIGQGKKYTYVLKMWIDSDTGNEVIGTSFKGQLRVEAVQSVKKNPIDEINPVTLTYDAANSAQKKEMFTFTHTAGAQQSRWSAEELTDYRYIGTNPNNYVTFNNEDWRIIGLFTVENDAGKKEKRLKIIRDESIGNYSFDNTGQNGESNWTTSSLQQVLNSGAYYNRTSGTCPQGGNGATTPCDFSNNGLTIEAKNMIGKTKWYLGGGSEYTSPSEVYKAERDNTVNSGRSINWIGEVGLMYASDYGYAASGSGCLNTVLFDESNNDFRTSCASTDWLVESFNEWMISAYLDHPYNVLTARSSGFVRALYAYNEAHVRPSVYLKSNVTITAGDGSKGNPYILKLNVKE